ncbi:hypothetical protein [Pseudomonas sp. BGI-2]|uniref:hypothetical protein n=1 Tax=Pseudomonas sp. BGI-2 TaxID=2528211 RepID=UPI0010337680|nr:hypothetical protein [Pseudomonas sp. BGI-2]TBN49846.1 hypothetical protein EYC95_04260 [Pseudomonas sp. BGI-2]
MTHPAFNSDSSRDMTPVHTITSLDMAALTDRPRRFIHRNITTLLEKLADAGLVGKQIGDAGLVRWFNKKADVSSYWVAAEYQYLDLRNRKQTALYIAKDFLMMIAGRIDCDVTRKKYVSMI